MSFGLQKVMGVSFGVGFWVWVESADFDPPWDPTNLTDRFLVIRSRHLPTYPIPSTTPASSTITGEPSAAPSDLIATDPDPITNRSTPSSPPCPRPSTPSSPAHPPDPSPDQPTDRSHHELGYPISIARSGLSELDHCRQQRTQPLRVDRAQRGCQGPLRPCLVRVCTYDSVGGDRATRVGGGCPLPLARPVAVYGE